MVKTLIIAEAGSSWRFGAKHLANGRRCIEIAKSAGADCVKFQWTSDPHLLEKRRKVKPFTYEVLDYPKAWIQQLAAHCEDVGIEFLCTVFLPADVEYMNQFVKRWKVASLEKDATDLREAMLQTGKTIIQSCGAAEQLIGESFSIQYLHCTASYPASPKSLNLRALESGHYTRYSGYSDHSGNMLTGALAVACGAEIVEVHMRLDRTPKDNPDYGHSLCPVRLKGYIANIRMAEIMLGDDEKRIQPCERWAKKHMVRI